MDKTVASAAEAVADIADGSSARGRRVRALRHPDGLSSRRCSPPGATDLSRRVSNNCGVDALGLWACCSASRPDPAHHRAPMSGENKEFARQFLSGELEVELTPQGTLAERLRAGGSGIGAFFTPTGVGTLVADGGHAVEVRRRRVGHPSPRRRRRCASLRTDAQQVLEEAIVTDYALVRAGRSTDTHGNLRSSTPRPATSTPTCAMAGRITIVEAEERGRAGRARLPMTMHLPGIYVHRVVALTPEQAAGKRIEKRTTRPSTEVVA